MRLRLILGCASALALAACGAGSDYAGEDSTASYNPEADVAEEASADAVAIADALHYTRYSLQELRKILADAAIPVRSFEPAT